MTALRRLIVEDFQLIARAELELGEHLTAITGETGSGKTMLLGAIEFVLGARASADAVRTGRKRARVALSLGADAELRASLAEAGVAIDDDEDEVILVRELADGKTSARINGMPVSAGQLRVVGAQVAEIVGQHEAQRLLVPAHQLDSLDRFGGAATLALRERVAEAHARKARAVTELAALENDEGRAAAESEYAEFAAREIEEAGPQVGDDDRLRERRELLANSERLLAALQTAHAALLENDEAVATAASSLAAIARYSPALDEAAAAAASLQAEAGELSATIARAIESVDVDPAELEDVTGRLEALDRLKKKYGGSIESMLEARSKFLDTMDRVATSTERRQALVRERDESVAALGAAATELTAARRTAARACEERVTAELGALAMGAARFEIAFDALEEIGPGGAERCDFRLAANPGEPPRALARSASGGELSRVMLALTVVLVDRSARVALIFDEIDAGIGGATANAVGARLADLARDAQVVCVTHLAQIAAYAGYQVVLRKQEAEGQTLIDLASLDAKGRLAELARMLSGVTTGVSLEHARALLRDRGAAV